MAAPLIGAAICAVLYVGAPVATVWRSRRAAARMPEAWRERQADYLAELARWSLTGSLSDWNRSDTVWNLGVVVGGFVFGITDFSYAFLIVFAAGLAGWFTQYETAWRRRQRERDADVLGSPTLRTHLTLAGFAALAFLARLGFFGFGGSLGFAAGVALGG